MFFSGLTQGCIYAFVALGVVIVYSMTRIFNLSVGMFVVLGAFLAITLYEHGLPLPLSIILGLAANCAIAAVTWMLFLHRPYSEAASHWTLLLIAATLGLVLMGVTYIIFGPHAKELPSFTGFKPSVGGVTVAAQSIWIWGVAILAVACLFFVFNRTLIGKAFRACSERPLAARLMGINPNFMALLSFILSALLGGIAGVIVVPLTTLSYGTALGLSVKGCLAAMLGGADRAEGAIAGGVLLGLLESFAGGFISARFMEAIALGCLIIILLIRSEGIFGIREEKFCRK